MSTSPRGVGVVLGAMDFGRFATESASLAMVEHFLSTGHSEVDTALVYAEGESEKIIGRFPSDVKRRLILHTKVNPTVSLKGQSGLTRDNVLNQCNESLTSLQLTPSPASPPLDILYLHMPDHDHPILDTLKGMQELFVQGKYTRLALSNFAAWQVMEVHQLCTQHHFVLPTVYQVTTTHTTHVHACTLPSTLDTTRPRQPLIFALCVSVCAVVQGMYNALTRNVEPELFPCLRHLNMSFYAYNPVMGGLLTGRYDFAHKPTEDGRFANNKSADMYLARYWKQPIFDAIDRIKATLRDKYGEGQGAVSLTDASLRWMMHHSQLKGEHGDAVILGASKLEHVTQNLKGIVGGPLDDAVVKAFDDAWQQCKGEAIAYFR